MPTIKRFEDLETWQTARQLTQLVYHLTGHGAFAKDYGLKDQIQRAAVSTMNNIAEGFESRTQRVFIDLLGRARGSAGEVRSLLYVAKDLDYITASEFDRVYEVADKASRQVYRFIAYLESRPNEARVHEDAPAYEV